jgi:hypothetical protein
MAQMLPASYPSHGPSDAEHNVFELLREQLSHEWTCLHSLGIAEHKRKVWAEIDFVLIGPAGVFCLEIKGGRVSRGDGVWKFQNRHGTVNEKREGPFEQVGSAAGALRGFFRTHRRRVLDSIVGYGVVMPDIPCTMEGPDVDREVVLDETGFSDGMKQYVDHLAQIWQTRYRAKYDRDPRPLDRAEREDVVSLLRGNFDLVPSLPTRVGWAKRELVQLTEEQGHLLELLEQNPRVLARGAAGTGKTVIAMEEASREAVDGARVLYLCFNRFLATSLRSVAPEHVTVSTLHALMAKLVREGGLDGELPDADERDLYEVFFPVLTLQALAADGAPTPYDVLVIDEGQDVLLDNYLDVLDKLLAGGLKDGRWRMFYDPNQNIFDGIGGPALERLLAFNPVDFPLQVNCRNTEQIAAAISMFSGCPALKTSVQGPEVETLWYRDTPDQRRAATNCVRRLLSQGIRPSEIVILSTKTLPRSCLKDGWGGEVGAGLREFKPGEDDGGAVSFSTIHSFKGLEADAVVVLDAVSADRSSPYLTYVGASRARVILSLLLAEEAGEEIAARYSQFGEAAVAELQASNGGTE